MSGTASVLTETPASGLVLLATGGTIASAPDDTGELIAHRSGRALAEAAGLDTVRVEDLLGRGSYALSLEEVVAIARRAVEIAVEPGTRAVIVAHGTDTMEETAFLCDLTYGGKAPIVFCGAQRPAAATDPDGPGNLRAAARFVDHPAAAGTGVSICMGDRVVAAPGAVKVDTSRARAFDARDHLALALFDEQEMQVLGRERRSAPVSLPSALAPSVALVMLGVGDDGAMIDAAVQRGARGVAIAAFGAGNANVWVVDAVRRAVAAGVVVTISSRCGYGTAAALYGDGGGHDLRRAGAIHTGQLSAQQARMLMMAMLADQNVDGTDLVRMYLRRLIATEAAP